MCSSFVLLSLGTLAFGSLQLERRAASCNTDICMVNGSKVFIIFKADGFRVHWCQRQRHSAHFVPRIHSRYSNNFITDMDICL
jgi:hypothetical protein